MTQEECSVISDRYPHLKWANHEDSRFVQLVGDPACPLLVTVDGTPTCAVHDIRPYNCRRWGCFRTSPEESFDNQDVKDRIAGNRDYRRQAVLMQRRAQKRALQHGWDPSME